MAPAPPPPGSPSEAGARFRRTEAIFGAARRFLDERERGAFLAKACAGDAALRAEVEAWLATHEEAERSDAEEESRAPFLAQVAWDAVEGEASALPKRLGRYRLRRLIGTGGMGTVYEAEQEDPSRVVALKLLHPELDEEVLRKRFRAEADLLARLHHPGIAHVYDVGAVDTQLGRRLYIAMERVEGRPLREYLDEVSPDRPARIRLMLSICEAVRHAHRNGVIHRDLKPSNILVQKDGTPKLLDFGVARHVDDDLGLTRTGHVVGTLRYMSPEQAAGDGVCVDSRADVYALGVIGYEMLSGRHPGRPRTTADGEPVGDVPALGTVDRSLRGDLSIIFARALEHDTADRYQDVDSLAEDLRRFLSREPILARPRSTLYRVRRFVSRHRITVPLAAGAVVALVGGLLLALGAAEREEHQRRRADRTARRAAQAAYAATIKAAAADLAAADSSAARHLLDELPTASRGWEWRYLRASLDHSAQVLAWRGAGARAEDALRTTVSVALDPGSRRLGHLKTTITPGGADEAPHEPDLQLAGGGVMLASPGAEVHGGRPLAVGGVVWQRLRDALVVRGPGHPEGGTRIETGTQLYDVRPSPKGNLLAAAGRDKSIRLFDMQTGALRGHLRGHRRAVRRLAFDATGERLASGDAGGAIFVWDVPRRVALRTLLGHPGQVRSLGMLADGSGLLSLDDGSLRFWDFETEQALGVLRAPAGPKNRFVYSVDVSPDGHHVASTRYDGQLEVACLATGTHLWSSRFDVLWRLWRQFRVRYSRDGRWLGVSEGVFHLFDARTGKLRWRAGREHQPGDFVFDEARGRVLAITPAALVAFHLQDGSASQLLGIDVGGRHTSAALSPDGQALAWSVGSKLHVRSLARERNLWSARRHEQAILETTWSPDGNLLVTASEDGTIRLWDARGGEALAVLRGHEAPVYALAFSPDGTRLASGGREGTIRLWEPTTGLNTLVLRAHDDYVHALGFDPTGHTLISASGDGTVRTWSIRPFAERCAERATLLEARARLRPRVETMFRAGGDPTEAWHRIDAGMDGLDRRAAEDLILILASGSGSK